ncbi:MULTISPECIES: HAMP domain-containing sensor histidine kinase [unclassified Ruegeria]|uniref:sensor histidine kinase n=1 Tax=unclassified Ruegeria TaxID=2625375 RepID=UPI001ADB4F8E|nr:MULTISPECIES: HAMP domain-containing sensor histidine kinase [unclassified Ruegeria]MBO9413633.1 HAMP domain-containing histidine kinase [Ruegeria sp. R8_1]MBO9417619.1 HAMP domain-containing histidine kinase [Ruegeria sp. R8_2]
MQGGVKPRKRPKLWTVVLLVLGIVLCLPFAGLALFRFYDSQLVQQTEESLLTQAAVLSATYSELYAEAAGLDPPKRGAISVDRAVFPALSVNRETVLPPRPDAQAMQLDPGRVYKQIAAPLSRIAAGAQTQTLVGYRFLDTFGNVFAGTAELGENLGQVAEVQEAMQGNIASVARTRLREDRTPAVYTLSRAARVRVFVAMPVFVEEAQIGAVYLSRTPNHIFRFLYGERFNLAKAAVFVALSTALIGFVFWRFITRPIRLLIERTQSAGYGVDAWEPPEHLGTREIEELSQSFQSLTTRLQNKQDALKTYTAHVTHELKSPLTALKGATELLRDNSLPVEQRNKLLDTVDKGGKRMEDLLAHMRAFSLADQSALTGSCRLDDVVPFVTETFPNLSVQVENGDLPLPVAEETLRIILTHLLENAQQHDASEIVLTAGQGNDATTLRVADNGTGVSDGNAGKIMQPFFTTRRNSGGTGMGLNIVTATAEAIGGRLSLDPSSRGACFLLTFG